MYGLVLDNMVSYIKHKYGDKVWREVQYVGGIDQDEFNINETYSEGIVHKIVWAAQDVTGASLEELMSSIGSTFYEYLAKYDYNKVLRVLGRSFPEFLNGLDNLHEYLRFTFPKLKPPSFYCEHESRTGITLHYRSKRRGFLHYVKGQIVNIAQELYKTEVKIELLDHENEDNMEHIILRLHFNNMEFVKGGRTNTAYEDLIRTQIRITSDIFFDIFPFIIVFNRGMRVRNIGLALLRMLPRLIGKKISQEFVLMRPLIRFRWEEIMLHSNNIFEMMTIEPVWEDDNLYIYRAGDAQELQEERRRMHDEEKQRFLSLKGQMMYMEEWESICFLGIPVMANLKQMYKTGLFINDFAMHDSSRDLVLASTQQAAELKLLLDQESQKSEKLSESMVRLKRERKRTDDLLYQLLPRAVADQLRRGNSAVATCETFESVTILFTDVVGFTTICSGLEPMAVVDFLNDMYSKFDELTEKHGVFKVETIGDAYMIVSGAPTKTPYHAEFTCDCALSIIESVSQMVERSLRKPVQIRAGVHTGSIVAGVVGLKMPRYCLFGETVLVANKMESTGSPMKVQLSDTTLQALNALGSHQFQTTVKGDFEIKEGKKIATHWLLSKSGPARVPEPPEEVPVDDDDDDGRVRTPRPGDTAISRQSAYTPVSDAQISRASSQMSALSGAHD